MSGIRVIFVQFDEASAVPTGAPLITVGLAQVNDIADRNTHKHANALSRSTIADHQPEQRYTSSQRATV